MTGIVAQLDDIVPVAVHAKVQPLAVFNVEAADIGLVLYHTSKLKDPLAWSLRITIVEMPTLYVFVFCTLNVTALFVFVDEENNDTNDSTCCPSITFTIAKSKQRSLPRDQ